MEAEPVLNKIKDAIRSKKLPRERPERLVEQATQDDIITRNERAVVRKAEAARTEAITVDAFTLARYLQTQGQASAEVSSVSPG